MGRFRSNQIAYTEHHVWRNRNYADRPLVAALRWLIMYERLDATSEPLVLRFPGLFPQEVAEMAAHTIALLQVMAAKRSHDLHASVPGQRRMHARHALDLLRR